MTVNASSSLILLNDLQINSTAAVNCAFSVKAGAQTGVTLEGVSQLISGDNQAGLQVANTATLTLSGNGQLTATGGNAAAGIGGGSYGNGGHIYITGGTVFANGTGAGAGIGGGSSSTGGVIEISGGSITATGVDNGPGIGGITGGTGVIAITSGSVTATGGTSAPAIGWVEGGGSVTVSGGTVNASGTSGGAGIGNGYNASTGVQVRVTAGTVTATGGSYAAGIGGGNGGTGGTVRIEGGAVAAMGGASGGAGIGGGYGSGVSGATLTILQEATVRASSALASRPAIHTVSGALEAGSTANILIASYQTQKSANTASSLYTAAGGALYASITPAANYGSVAFCVPLGTYRLKAGGTSMQHSALPNTSINFSLVSAGITNFATVTPAVSYPITVGTLTGGGVTAPVSAPAGETVELVVTPDANMRLKSGTLQYTYNSSSYAVTGTSFTMPPYATTITAQFEEDTNGPLTAPAISLAGDNTDGGLSYTITPDAGQTGFISGYTIQLFDAAGISAVGSPFSAASATGNVPLSQDVLAGVAYTAKALALATAQSKYSDSAYGALSGSATAADAPEDIALKNYTAGSTIRFAGYNWILLDPETGYLLFKDIGTVKMRFDSTVANPFDPSVSTNIGYYLNETFYPSLPAADRARIQTHSWGIGAVHFSNGGDESTPAVSANIGLISYNEWKAYQRLIGYPATGLSFWTRNGFVETDGTSLLRQWIVVSFGANLGGEVRNAQAYARPAIYLSPDERAYSVTYHLNGGTNNAANPAGYFAGSAFTLSVPEKSGNAFLGWFDNAALSGSPVTGILATDSGAKELYASWIVIPAALGAPSSGFDKNPALQADITAAITWNGASAVTDIQKDGVSIGADSYSVSGSTLTIKKEYLATQAVGSLTLSVLFDAGTGATLALTITDTTPPSISPSSATYDLNAPGSVSTAITWNTAATLTGVTHGVTTLTQNTDYTISGSTLTILDEYLADQNYSEGDTASFTLSFDTGATAVLLVTVADSYIKSSDATLSDLTAGGTTVSEFAASRTQYDVTLPRGTQAGSAAATIGATASDAKASVVLSQAAALPGSATVTVTAEDGTQMIYTITLTLRSASSGGSSGASAPRVTTASVSDVTISGATLTGAVSAGGAGVTERGFVISTASSPTLDDEDSIRIPLGSGAGSFTATVDSLLPGTTYYARAYAISRIGVGYGDAIPLATGFVGDGVYAIPKTGDAVSPAGFVLLLTGMLGLLTRRGTKKRARR